MNNEHSVIIILGLGFIFTLLCINTSHVKEIRDNIHKDYTIELDSIDLWISDKQGNRTNIELDSLEEFIIKDNL